MLKIGDLIHDFTAPDQLGKPMTLTNLLQGGPVVIFFYPRAMTAGCTAQSCHFRDLAQDFHAVGASIVGISSDSVERQATFDQKHRFGFPLLSDPNKIYPLRSLRCRGSSRARVCAAKIADGAQAGRLLLRAAASRSDHIDGA
jgi:peroxiredoxin